MVFILILVSYSQSDTLQVTPHILVKSSDLIKGHLQSNTETLWKITFYLSLSQSILIVYKQEQSSITLRTLRN